MAVKYFIHIYSILRTLRVASLDLTMWVETVSEGAFFYFCSTNDFTNYFAKFRKKYFVKLLVYEFRIWILSEVSSLKMKL